MSLGHQRGKVIKQLVNLLGEEASLAIIIVVVIITIVVVITAIITIVVVVVVVIAVTEAAAIISMVAVTVLAASWGFFLLCLSKVGDVSLEGAHRTAVCLAKYWPLLVHNVFCTRKREVK